MSDERTTDAVEILYRRFIRGRPEMETAVELATRQLEREQRIRADKDQIADALER